MPKKKSVLDANVLLRFLLNDIPSQVARIKLLLREAADNSLVIPDVVITEMVFVMQKYYSLEKADIVEKISLILDFPKFKTNRKVIATALDFYLQKNFSFTDAYLCALVKTGQNSPLYTFDKGILKQKDIKSQQP